RGWVIRAAARHLLQSRGRIGNMDSEARDPADTRLRLVDLRVDGEHLLHFGGGFSGVLAGNGTRSTAARAIACTIVGPRPSGVSGPRSATASTSTSTRPSGA